MDTAKYKILKDTLDNSFNIEEFKRFIREFFNGPDMLPATRQTGIWREYENYVQCYYRIAEYIDEKEDKLIVLAVELKKGRTVELARSMQRNFVSKILDNNDYNAAIVAFYSEDQPNWRLSFVRQDYTLTEKGLEIDLTPARRYSYLVGENEPKHTAEAQLFPLFKDDESNPTLDEIEEAFSVERVTNDFFNQYKEKYLQLKEYLENDEMFIKESDRLNLEADKFAEQFSKKLMGQLAFLYFIQKKGWLGVTLLPEDRELLESEYQKIYQSVEEANKIVLEKYFVRQGGKRRLNTILLRKEMTDHEADLLSDCFVDTEHDMPWGSGNPRFISDLCKYCIDNTKENFFNYFLEPFFYEGLNTKRKNDYYKRFNCKIPFLNGGLFEPLEGYHWKDVKFKIPNDIFTNKKDENDREADGIIDIFDRYNFTINENEPLEKDVAVDPEMLGKIFENLLEVTDRKSKGAFYTPREIVHYMCQESLINYLVNEVDVPYEDMREFILYGELIRDVDSRSGVGYSKEFRIKESIFNNILEIDKALENVRIADPAVGSGAFPLGMLNEIIRARTNITEYIIVKNNEGIFDRKYNEDFIRRWRSPYKMKLDTIKDSIFAVDIEPSAVDIAKLRLWLSIIVDQEIDEEYPKPQPLPNLDSNILVGNSLIDEYEGIKLFDKSILDKHRIGNGKQAKAKPKQLQMDLMRDYTDELLDEMFKLQNRLFEENNEEKKNEIKSEINKIRDDLIVYTLEKNGNHEGLKKYNELKDEKMKPYFIWELEFAKVFQEKVGFDIVIGNPPYVDNETMSKIEKDFYKENYIAAIGHYDIYIIFYEKGFRLLKNGGIISYITSNKWMAQKYGYALRRIFLANKIIKLIDFNKHSIFDTATVDTQITLAQKQEHLEKYKSHKELPIFNYTFKGYYHRSDERPILIDLNFIDIETVMLDITDQINFKLELTKEDINIIKKVRYDSISFNNIYYVTLGAVIHCEGSQNTKDEFLHSNFQQGYKRYYEGKDVEKWVMNKNRKYLNYKPDMHREPRFKELFENSKIVSIRMSTQKNPHRFAIDEGGYIADSAIVAINYNKIKHINNRSIKNEIKNINLELCDNLDDKYVLGILNSNLMYWYFFKILSDGLHFYPSHLKQLPIKIPTDKEQKKIIQIVDKLIGKKIEHVAMKNNIEKDDVEKLELELNNLIYKLYGINDIEIQSIEEFLN